jgi:collagen type VI alpha
VKGVDVAFVIDKTSNMNYDNYQNIILNMFANVITNLQIDQGRGRVALITFSDTPMVEFYFDGTRSGIETAGAIRRASYGGARANLADALRVLRTDVFNTANGHRADPNITSVAVILTDNVSTNRTATLLEAQRARDAGINIITIGVGTYLDEYELSAVASYPYKTNMIIKNTVKALAEMEFTNNIQSLICNNGGTCSGQAICGSSGTCMESFGEFTCSCSAGRTGRFCNNSECCDINANCVSSSLFI